MTNFFQAWTEEKNIVFLQDGTVGKVAEKLRVICWDGAPEELINHQYRVFLQDGFSEFEPESEISVRLDNSTFKCLQESGKLELLLNHLHDTGNLHSNQIVELNDIHTLTILVFIGKIGLRQVSEWIENLDMNLEINELVEIKQLSIE